MAFSRCVLSDAAFDGCDPVGAVFDDCVLRLTEFGRGAYQGGDLRGSGLSALRGVGAPAGVVIDSAQQTQLAEALAAEPGVTYGEDPGRRPLETEGAGARTLCSVSTRHRGSAARSQPCEPPSRDRTTSGTVVPTGEWMPLGPDLADRLRPTGTAPEAALVESVRPPQAEPDELARMATSTFRPDHLPGRASPEYLGYVVSEPQALTTTGDPASGRRSGPHVDHWDRLPVAVRHLSRRRPRCNCGPGTRCLLLATPPAPLKPPTTRSP